MKDTRYTITSKKVVALALALVLLATMFVGCNGSKDDETTTTTTTTEVQTTIEIVTEIVTDEDGETVTDDNGEALTTEVTKIVEVSSQSDEDEEPSSEKSSSTTSTTKGSTTTTTKQTETTTKKNTSTNNSNKVTTTNKNLANCSHSWGAYKWGNTETTYGDKWRTCSKCGKSESWELCNHSFGTWQNVRLNCQERYCSKCGWEEMRDADNCEAFMGNKSEYLELLGYVNEARKEAGLNELVYCGELQSGADTRAKELTVKYSHTRPNGKKASSVYEDYKYTTLHGYMFVSSFENIVANAPSAKSAFTAWMNSSGHKETIMLDGAFGFAASRCDGYWMMVVVCGSKE